MNPDLVLGVSKPTSCAIAMNSSGTLPVLSSTSSPGNYNR